MGFDPLPVYREPSLTPVSAPDIAREYPLILTNSGKIREFFPSEGRQIERLRRSQPDPLVEIHPETAPRLNIAHGDWVWIETPEARVTMRARLFGGIAPDVVAAQAGWWFPESEAPERGWNRSNVNLLYGDMECDPETNSESIHSALCKVHPVGQDR